MIGYLRGKVLKQGDKYILLDVSGVGYKVFCNTLSATFSDLEQTTELELFIHTVVREDALELFGFPDESSLRLFEKLINISGIGPRGALAIVNAGTVETLTEAINKGDLGYLTAVSGIGKKTAEKIILELRGQISDLTLSDENAEVVLALRAMGYTQRDAEEATKDIKGKNINEKIKNALKKGSK
jgi:Holliday junction DNA helicase RuvA